MSLKDLPEIQFVDEDVNKIKDRLISNYEKDSGLNLYPADPVRIFLLSIAKYIAQERVLLNQTARQNLLRYARGAVLDHKGAGKKTPRLPAMPARTTIEFQLSIVRTSATMIPAGIRVGVQDGGELYFSTMTAMEIPAGSLSGTISAECTVPGATGNSFLPGQITALIDPIPFVQSVTNTTESSGGADEESDDAYRERIHAAPESFSVAGPDGAYRFWAFTASQLIVDVSVTNPTPGEALIIPLLSGGKLPGQEILDRILEILNDKKIRPLTDHVRVEAPQVQAYNLDFTYWIDINHAASVDAIQKAVDAAVEDYVLWQKSKLGRNINPSELILRLMQAGAHHVDVVTPSYTEVNFNQIAVAVQINFKYGGLTDD